MDKAQQALISTIDRILRERGDDPSVIAPQDKMTLAAQLVQLCQLHEHEMRKASEELAGALGCSSALALAELASNARVTIEMQGSPA